MSAVLVVSVLLLLATCALAFRLPSLSPRGRKVEALIIAAALLGSWLFDRYASTSAQVERTASLLLLGYVLVRSTKSETRLLPNAALAVSAIVGYGDLLHTPVSPLIALLCSFAPSRTLHALLVTVFLVQLPIVLLR